MWRITAFKYRITTDFTQWLAHRLPKRLRYFAMVDIVAHASGGKYEKNTNVNDLTAMEVLRRFGKDKGIE